MNYHEQNMLNHWYNERLYDNKDCVAPFFRGYTEEDMGKTTLGRTSFHYDTSKRRYGVIVLHPSLKKHRILMEGVLWHEFCHAWEWSEDATTGHGSAFKKREKSNRRLYFYDILAKLACPFIR